MRKARFTDEQIIGILKEAANEKAREISKSDSIFRKLSLIAGG